MSLPTRKFCFNNNFATVEMENKSLCHAFLSNEASLHNPTALLPPWSIIMILYHGCHLSLLNLRLLNRSFVVIDTTFTEPWLSPNDFTSATKYLKALWTGSILIYTILQNQTNSWLFFDIVYSWSSGSSSDEKLLDIELFVPGSSGKYVENESRTTKQEEEATATTAEP